ncbi:hypothetical protein F8M41_004652 [Gigaspora margarita]|uniref:Uncharacterized protein n=1 Tax=Gigaspora margarita TaxID=4874 RepID=A0A8H3XA58_GIGMA|nr:hypothetical protein F8M41_004652 [Gigaspora margarita]
MRGKFLPKNAYTPETWRKRKEPKSTYDPQAAQTFSDNSTDSAFPMHALPVDEAIKILKNYQSTDVEVSLYINPSTSMQYGQTHNIDNMASEFNLNKPTGHVSEQTNDISDNSIDHVGSVIPQIDLNKSIDYTPQEPISCIPYYSYCPSCQNYYYYPYYSQISDPNR